MILIINIKLYKVSRGKYIVQNNIIWKNKHDSHCAYAGAGLERLRTSC
jgi:hypothetical protein